MDELLRSLGYAARRGAGPVVPLVLNTTTFFRALRSDHPDLSLIMRWRVERRQQVGRLSDVRSCVWLVGTGGVTVYADPLSGGGSSPPRIVLDPDLPYGYARLMSEELDAPDGGYEDLHRAAIDRRAELLVALGLREA